MATMYATDQAGADRKRKAVQRLKAAQLAAQMLHQATQQQGLPQSPTPGKPVLPHRPLPGGPGQGRPIADPRRPSLADAQGLDPQLGPGLAGARAYSNGLAGRGPLHDTIIRHMGAPEYITGGGAAPQGQGSVSGRGQAPPANNLATGQPYGQAAHMPERRPPGEHLPGKPNLGGRPQFGGPDNGRPQVSPLEEQLVMRMAQAGPLEGEGQPLSTGYPNRVTRHSQRHMRHRRHRHFQAA